MRMGVLGIEEEIRSEEGSEREKSIEYK